VFRVEGGGWRVEGSGCRVQGAGLRVEGAEYHALAALASLDRLEERAIY